MANKILPEAVKAELRRLSANPKRRLRPALTAAARKPFVEWGRQGRNKAAPKLTPERLRQAGKAGGEKHLQTVCARLGIDYGALPDTPKRVAD